MNVLFADDTSPIGKARSMNETVRITKEVMKTFEEKNNEGKEESLEFGTEEGGEKRVLGSWMNTKRDIANRKSRAGKLWGKVKSWLKGSRLSKTWQAKIVEACVESSLIYDCQARTWYKRDTKRLQQFMDKCYRFVWSNRRGQPLRQMEELGINMQDIRNRLKIKSIRWKIEKIILVRIEALCLNQK